MQIVEFVSYEKSVKEALDGIGGAEVLARQKAILIKPNLVEAIAPPVTTPVQCCEAIVKYIRACSKAEVVIAEGCGAAQHETDQSFKVLGYTELSQRLQVPLVDLNHAKTLLCKNKSCKVFPEFHLPEIALSHFVISVPVLKAHSFAKITGTLKNMMGFAPPKYYQQGGHWKKSAFHSRMHESIIELNRYRTPDLTVLDATIGLQEYHMGGRQCDPPVNKLVAGFDPVEVDRTAAQLLGFDWKQIPHLVKKQER